MADYDLGEAFKAIEEELIASMIRNMDHHRAEETKEGIQWSQWQVEQLNALEEYRRENREKFNPRFRDINAQIPDLIDMARQQGGMDQEASILEAMKQGLRTRKTSDAVMGEFFTVNDRKLNALVNATQNDFSKAEHAVLRMADDKYRKAIFNAQVYANAGGTTYEKAVDMATRDMLRAGLNCVEYKNGARHTLSDYADMCLKTATKRAYLTGEGEKRKEWGIATVIMNKRGNPCPLCAPWCGKVLIDDVWSGGKPDGKHPLMSTAIEKGLYHPRCKDVHTTYFPGISTADDPYDRKEREELVEDYNQEQKQSYYERQAEQCERIGKYSLDSDNKKTYQERAKRWGQKAESGNIHQLSVGSNDVDKKQLKSKEYSKKFKRITQNSVVNQGIRKYAKAMLTHRSGSNGEDLIIIDAETGKRRFAKTKGKNILGVELTQSEIEEIKEIEYKIGIHNHPSNVLPTGSDLVSAGSREYEFGIVVTHDLRIFKYRVGDRPFTSSYVDSKVDKYLNNPYNFNIIKAQERVLDELAKEGLIEWEEIK